MDVVDIGPRFRTQLSVERCIATAQAFVGVAEQGGENRGQMVELFLKGVGLEPGQPWCAAFVHHVGWWSQYDVVRQRSRWPLPATGACAVLGEFAQQHALLMPQPQRGDVFLWYDVAAGHFHHTGIVLDVSDASGEYICTTIEGNTTADGSREGTTVLVRTRHFAKSAAHRFVRWTELVPPLSTLSR